MSTKTYLRCLRKGHLWNTDLGFRYCVRCSTGIPLNQRPDTRGTK